jgi:lysozyme
MNIPRIFALLIALQVSAFASNCVVNLSHYDLMHPNFGLMRQQGIVGVIHEATYPRFDRDALYARRRLDATHAGLLWGAYHFGDATDPVRQADHFLSVVSSAGTAPNGVLLVLDFEKNGHYPGGTMRPEQAVAFVERIRQRTGRYPGVYGSENRLRAVVNAGNVSAAQRRVFASCWLWIANYHWTPRMVAPWNQWVMWQYTGDGKCDLRPSTAYPKGIANIARAERNMFRGTSTEAVTFWQEHAWIEGVNSTASR